MPPHKGWVGAQGSGQYPMTQTQYDALQEARRLDQEAARAKMAEPNPWQPISNPVDLAHLGKLGEELNEAGAAVNRCIIQGLDGAEPVTGKVNRAWLQDELADVLGMIDLAIERFGLDAGAMAVRSHAKKTHKRAWHKMIKERP